VDEPAGCRKTIRQPANGARTVPLFFNRATIEKHGEQEGKRPLLLPALVSPQDGLASHLLLTD
jgi:hypothetical protein